MANFSNSDPINRDDVTPHNMYDNAWTTYNVPRTQLTHDNDLDSVLPNQEQRADIWGSYAPKLEPPTIDGSDLCPRGIKCRPRRPNTLSLIHI